MTRVMMPGKRLRADWAAAGLEGLDGPAYDRHLDEVWARLGVNDACSDYNDPHLRLEEGCRQLGYRFKRVTRNADPTTYDPALYNEDLAPVPLSRRAWGLYNYVSLWVAMSVCIPTYMLASGLIAGGMNWWQAVGTILLGNLIVLIPMLLNAHAGARYGIPFPVFVRASFGVRGANVMWAT